MAAVFAKGRRAEGFRTRVVWAQPQARVDAPGLLTEELIGRGLEEPRTVQLMCLLPTVGSLEASRLGR